MTYKVFLDVNIIVDTLDPLRPFHKDAVTLFHNLDSRKAIAFYSESVITTVAYVIRKDFDKGEICKIIEALNKKMELLPCSSNNVNNAINKIPPDFEDALLYEMALEHPLDYFITSNTKDFQTFQSSRLPVLKAQEFNVLLISK